MISSSGSGLACLERIHHQILELKIPYRLSIPRREVKETENGSFDTKVGELKIFNDPVASGVGKVDDGTIRLLNSIPIFVVNDIDIPNPDITNCFRKPTQLKAGAVWALPDDTVFDSRAGLLEFEGVIVGVDESIADVGVLASGSR